MLKSDIGARAYFYHSLFWEVVWSSLTYTHTPVLVLKGGIWARAYAPERVAGDRSEFDPRPIQHWLSCRIEAKSNTALLTDTKTAQNYTWHCSLLLNNLYWASFWTALNLTQHWYMYIYYLQSAMLLGLLNSSFHSWETNLNTVRQMLYTKFILQSCNLQQSSLRFQYSTVAVGLDWDSSMCGFDRSPSSTNTTTLKSYIRFVPDPQPTPNQNQLNKIQHYSHNSLLVGEWLISTLQIDIKFAREEMNARPQVRSLLCPLQINKRSPSLEKY